MKLTRKVGPLPVWGWMLVVAGLAFLWFSLRGRRAEGDVATDAELPEFDEPTSGPTTGAPFIITSAPAPAQVDTGRIAQITAQIRDLRERVAQLQARLKETKNPAKRQWIRSQIQTILLRIEVLKVERETIRRQGTGGEAPPRSRGRRMRARARTPRTIPDAYAAMPSPTYRAFGTGGHQTLRPTLREAGHRDGFPYIAAPRA